MAHLARFWRLNLWVWPRLCILSFLLNPWAWLGSVGKGLVLVSDAFAFVAGYRSYSYAGAAYTTVFAYATGSG